MSRIHQISHDNEFVRGKVNFFADYFDYAAENSGILETMEIENELSLFEKILFQIETNPEKNSKYIEVYLSHPIVQNLLDHSKDDKNIKKLLGLIPDYISQKHGNRPKWLTDNTQFQKLLLTIKRSLQIGGFKASLNNIVSYLICKHPIEFHREELIAQTNSIISELILNDRSKTDLSKIFQRILSRRIEEFPFPKSMVNQGDDVKEDFIKNRTFAQQFDGIYNHLREPLSKTFLIFRVYGLEAPETFYFKYDKVSFYSPSHPKLSAILKEVNNSHPLSDFLEKDHPVVAVIRAESHSIDISVNKSVESINKAIQFINRAFNSSCRIERFAYLYTSDFVQFGWNLNNRVHPYSFSNKSSEILSDNPFQFLRNSSQERKKILLRNEHLFIESLGTQNISTYWQYLENVIPGTKTIETISDILVIDSEKKAKRVIYNQIINSIIQVNADRFGLEKNLFESFFSQIQKGISVKRLRLLREKSSHSFLNYLLDQYLKPFGKEDFKNARAFYIRNLREAYAQRNSMLHAGIVHDKSIIQLTGTLPKLIRRLRIQLFNGIKSKAGGTHSEIVEALRLQGRKLWE